MTGVAGTRNVSWTEATSDRPGPLPGASKVTRCGVPGPVHPDAGVLACTRRPGHGDGPWDHDDHLAVFGKGRLGLAGEGLLLGRWPA